MRRLSWVKAAIFTVAAFAAAPRLCHAQYRHWTQQAIIEAPRVLQTAISAAGATAFYITRQDHLATNRRDSALFEVDLARKSQRLILRSPWISQLRQIPGSNDWSLLADVGNGVQLYRLTSDRKLHPIVLTQNTVIIGADPDKAVAISADEAEERFGVLGYAWSPDGRALWYSTAKRVAALSQGYVVMESPTVPLDTYRSNISELHYLDEKGRDRLMAASRGASEPYPSIVYRDAAARWDAHPGPDGRFGLTFMQPSAELSGRHGSGWVHFAPSTGKIEGVEAPDAVEDTDGYGGGPSGGRLAVAGPWSDQHLLEIRADGTTTDFGQSDIDKAGKHLVWWFPALGVSVMAVRHVLNNDREGLVRISGSGPSRDLDADLSMENCAFAVKPATGVCIRNGISVPPTLVQVDVLDWKASAVLEISSALSQVPPLTVTAKRWGTTGNEASGFILYPRNYDPSIRYPAILLVHGSDAENRFADPAFQWSYPAQIWAERGYFVIYVNDIYAGQSAERLAADEQWQGGQASLPRDVLRQRLWLDEATLYKEIVAELAGQGLVDPNRVGIAGYSRGSQKVNVALTQTDIFAAASTGDGAYFAPSQYWFSGIHSTDQILFGGSPYDASSMEAWRSISPVFRAGNVSAAVLFQVARVLNSRVDFYRALRDRNVPAEFEFFGDETHLLHKPSDRRVAMTQNLDWFDYWLRGATDPTPAKTDQYRRWDMMKESQAAASH